ncbi:polysaccharide biosynthesis protein [Aurantimonas aggregata]|nr:nucleoside-diphosphate sugar epimerase/dehydratase [Aurantimonas aggregata]
MTIKMSKNLLRMVMLRGAAWVHDTLMGVIALLLSLALRLDRDVFVQNLPTYTLAALVFGVVVGIVGFVVGMNRGIWRYASLLDFVAIAKTATIATCLFIVFHFMLVRLESIPRSAPIIAWAFLIILLAAPRAGYRSYRNQRDRKRDNDSTTQSGKRVLLVGATDTADAFIKATEEGHQSRFEVLAIIDERGRRSGRFIRGVPIVGTLDAMEEAVARFEGQGRRPDAVVLTRSRKEFSRYAHLEDLVELAGRLKLEVLCLPDMFDMQDLDAVSNVRPVKLEDLLQREPLHLDGAPVAAMIKNRTIMITGAGGSIGSELARQIAALEPSNLVLVDASEYLIYSIERELRQRNPRIRLHAALCNVRERDSIARVINATQPSVVFHAAALKHVPIVEAQPLEGLHTNAIGTRNVAEAAAAAKVEAMILVSTDKAVRPWNVMGGSKRLAEMFCQAMDLNSGEGDTRFITVRFGNVLGSAGSVIPLFEKQLKEGGPLTVTHPEIERYFMTISEACLLILQSAAHSLSNREQRGRIFVLDMGSPVKIADLARNVIRLSGMRPDADIKILYTGLRPGEKLYEELFDPDELTDRTGIANILAAFPRPIEWRLVQRIFEQMEEMIRDNDLPGAIRLLKSTVQEFVPSQEIQAMVERERTAPPLLGITRVTTDADD